MGGVTNKTHKQSAKGYIIGRKSFAKISAVDGIHLTATKALEPGKIIPDSPNAHPISLQHWYPRMWDEWAISKDGAKPSNLYSQVEEFSFPETDGEVTFNLLGPDFAADGALDSPRYANEVYPKFYGQGDMLLADVLPYEHGKQVLQATGGFVAFPGEFRIGHTGLIHLIKWKQRERWKVPLAEDIFFAWLKDKGFEPELSTCGRLAKQVHSQLAGWLGALTHEDLLILFEKMNRGGEEGKGLSLGEVILFIQ